MEQAGLSTIERVINRAGTERFAGGMRRPAAFAALILLALAAGCGHPVPVRPAVTLSFCGDGPQSAPTLVEVVCNTDDLTARNLVWSGWGSVSATAAGTAVVDLCAYTDCHTGAFSTVPVRLVASKIKACPSGRAYTTLRYLFADGSPWPALPADFKTSGYIAAPDRTLPPADQTVTLTCG